MPQPGMPPTCPHCAQMRGGSFCWAGPGARAAPAGRLPQISGPSATRARLLRRGLRGLAPAVLAWRPRLPRRTGCPHSRQRREHSTHRPVSGLQDPLLPAARALRLRGGLADLPLAPAAVLAADEPDRGAAPGAVPLLLAHARRLRPAAWTGRGPTPPSPGPPAAWRGTAGRSTGVVSTSNRSSGVQSSAVHKAARVDSFTWAGSLVNSADTDADDSSRPARSASSRRSWVPVHTSRWAAAIRSRHRIFTPPAPLRPARRASRRPHGDRRPR